jgi:hypothetical protein
MLSADPPPPLRGQDKGARKGAAKEQVKRTKEEEQEEEEDYMYWDSISNHVTGEQKLAKKKVPVSPCEDLPSSVLSCTVKKTLKQKIKLLWRGS